MASIYRKSDIPEHLQCYFEPAEIGFEASPDAYVAELVAVFREVRRVLREDGTCWLNIGDSYAVNGAKNTGRNDGDADYRLRTAGNAEAHHDYAAKQSRQQVTLHTGLKPKDLIGIPWRVAFALQADGWYLRQDIIWSKPNPMPESVRDRCTKAHEYVFLLTKSARYWYDADAVGEVTRGEVTRGEVTRGEEYGAARGCNGRAPDRDGAFGSSDTRNRRSVWTIASQPFSGSHFATMPPTLARLCILAGCPVGGTVLDPFGGSGTTGKVAIELARNAILCELNPEYVSMIEKRTQTTMGLGL